MKRKVYIETSVISYLTARPSKNVIEAGHQQSTYLFWDRRSEFDLVASELVVTECGSGDASAANKRLDALLTIPLLDVTARSFELAKVWLSLESSRQGQVRMPCIFDCHGTFRGLSADVELAAYCQSGNSDASRLAFPEAGLVPAFHLHT